MAFPEFQTKEVLNKVLNSGKDALKVDIDNVSLDGSQLSVDIDKENDSIVIFSNTVADGSGTNTVPLVDAAGHTQVDIISSALPSGGATAANQSTIIGHVDGLETLITSTNSKIDTLDAVQDNALTKLGEIETTNNANQVLLGTIDADTDAIKTDMAAIEVLLTAANVDHAANEALLTTIDSDTNDIKTDMAAIEVLLTAANVDHDAIETATEASQASLADMIYGTAVAIDIGSGNHTSLTHNALYVGTGGNVKVNMGTSGTGITFSNVASGQILPIQITQVWQSGTTASNMVALKE